MRPNTGESSHTSSKTSLNTARRSLLGQLCADNLINPCAQDHTHNISRLKVCWSVCMLKSVHVFTLCSESTLGLLYHAKCKKRKKKAITDSLLMSWFVSQSSPLAVSLHAFQQHFLQPRGPVWP